jgi:hypothetical protein
LIGEALIQYRLNLERAFYLGDFAEEREVDDAAVPGVASGRQSACLAPDTMKRSVDWLVEYFHQIENALESPWEDYEAPGLPASSASLT